MSRLVIVAFAAVLAGCGGAADAPRAPGRASATRGRPRARGADATSEVIAFQRYVVGSRAMADRLRDRLDFKLVYGAK